jgi:hypothetical protein
MKKHNGFNIFNKLLLFIPLIFLNYLNIPYKLSHLFTNFIFYLFSLTIVIILIKNEEYIYAVYFMIFIYILIKNSKLTYIDHYKNNQRTRTKNMISYNTNLNEISLEENIIKNLNKIPLNIPDKKNFQLKEC